jgi:proline dehydrogenase
VIRLSVGKALIPRWAAYRLATSDRFERVVRSVSPAERQAYRAARRYVAGPTLDDAIEVVARLRDLGLGTSLDLFGEGLADASAVRSLVERYRKAAAAVGDLDADIDLEVVPSHLGLDISPEFFRAQLELLIEALPQGARLQVSAEDNWRTQRVLDAAVALGAVKAPVVVTLQANLKRSRDDAERLIETGIPVRLVKGAYLEDHSVAHPWGEETDIAFVQLAHRLHGGGVPLSIGTHDPVIREALLAALPGIGVEMLLGVRTADARLLVDRGYAVRIYVPYGEDWFRYWMRRWAESLGH